MEYILFDAYIDTIEYILYGVNQKYISVTDICIRKLKTSGRLKITNSQFNADPCRGVPKKLIIGFNNSMTTSVYKENQVLVIDMRNITSLLEVKKEIVIDQGGYCPEEKTDFVLELIADNDINTIAEIGVYRGGFLLPLSGYLKSKSNAKTFGIDPYKTYIQEDIQDRKRYDYVKRLTADQEKFDRVYNDNLKLIEKYKLNCTLIRKESGEAYSNFENNSIDILHIDGCHDTDFVKADANNYYPKIKIGGYIIFDDTNWESVKKAYDEFVKTHNDKLEVIKVTWGWICIRKLREL